MSYGRQNSYDGGGYGSGSYGGRRFALQIISIDKILLLKKVDYIH
jgi:hypothetical protein